MAIHHDSYLLATFGEPRLFAAWLRCVLPPELQARLNWATLRRVGERHTGLRLRSGTADLVFAIDFADGSARLLVFVEHRSHRALDLHDTMLRYAVHLQHVARRDWPDQPTFALGAVMSHGDGSPELLPRSAMAAGSAVAAPWLPFQPRIAVLVDHLNHHSEAELLARAMPPAARVAQLALRFLAGWDGPTTIEAIGRWADLLREVAEEDQAHGSDHLEAFFGYVLQANETAIEELQMAIDRHLQEQRGSFMSTAEKLRVEGLARGLERGRVEGRVEALRRLLIRRFGPLPASAEAQLVAASQPELDQWLDRVLDAADLPAVFLPPATC
jgi:hypothetical protein